MADDLIGGYSVGHPSESSTAALVAFPKVKVAKSLLDLCVTYI
jgi:hypothetical protein